MKFGEPDSLGFDTRTGQPAERLAAPQAHRHADRRCGGLLVAAAIAVACRRTLLFERYDIHPAGIASQLIAGLGGEEHRMLPLWCFGRAHGPS